MSSPESTRWGFQSEAVLEEFVWENLEVLLDLKPLARQHYVNNQVCDILGVSSNRQLTIIELKNAEDRYIVQQLTRYYSAVTEAKSFEDQIDYSLPVRLIAIAPEFHAHNLIDVKYSRLDIELFTFTILPSNEPLNFELKALENEQKSQVGISSYFHKFLARIETEEIVSLEPVRVPSRPPKSLQKLLDGLPSAEHKEYILNIRERILNFDERMAEVGLTTSTKYGLRKGSNEIYKTKLCAEFIPIASGIYKPRLLLFLPHQKRVLRGAGRTYKRVAGMAWADVRHQNIWDINSAVNLYFYLGKSRSHHSTMYNLENYTHTYNVLTSQNRVFSSFYDLLDLALEEWKKTIQE